MTRVTGGRNTYGYAVGVLMLQSVFPRIPGDMGNATTFPYPVKYAIVPGATPHNVVVEGAARMLDPFVEAARGLERDGVSLITTNCGFLAMFQPELAASVRVPVITSSLLLVPQLQRFISPDQKIGILTVHAGSLNERHFSGAGWSDDDREQVVIRGMDGRYFSRVLLGNLEEMDTDRMADDLVEAASRMLNDHPEIGPIVFECTNMIPYAHQVQAATQRPVFDILSLVGMTYAVLRRRPYEGYM